MKNRNVFKVVLFQLLISVLIVSCQKDNKAELEKTNNEVRASLEGEIVFYKHNSIFKTNAKSGGSGSLLVANASGFQNGLKWSPDGSKVAFLKNTFDGSQVNWYLTISSKDGVEEQNWILGELFSGFRGITWSPDGNNIATLSQGGNQIIYFEVGTGKFTSKDLITRPGYFYSSIAWWPKGNQIAIAESRSTIFSNDDENKYIWMVNAFESDSTQIPDNLLVTVADPLIFRIDNMDWSTEGSKLAYSENSYYSSIYIVNSDGTNNHKIMSNGFGPCWMSNNEQLIFTGATGVNGSTLISGLFVTDINGSYKVDLKIPGEYPDCY